MRARRKGVICLWQEAKTQRLRATRARPLGKTAGASFCFAVLSLPLSSLARADSSNLLPNGSFQSGTSGWKATDAAFTIASDGASVVRHEALGFD